MARTYRRNDDGYCWTPQALARLSAASKRALANPEVRARLSAARKRAWAKAAVRRAGLPLLRQYVDRAAALFAAGECSDVIVDALQCEFGQQRRRRV